MRLSDELTRVVVIAPHADDEALGCGGLLARLHQRACATHVLYIAVDGFHHYGYPGETTYEQRLKARLRAAAIRSASLAACRKRPAARSYSGSAKRARFVSSGDFP